MVKFAVALACAAVAVQATESGPYYGGAAPYGGQSYGAQDNYERTYGYVDKPNVYSIYNAPRGNKPLRANDGYLVKTRTDPYKRPEATVYGKCLMKDPEMSNDKLGCIYFRQAAGDNFTSIWGHIGGTYGASVTINALGDLTDGCANVGDVFHPSVSASGYSYNNSYKSAPGQIDIKLDDFYKEDEFVTKAEHVDMSGTHSIVGRSLVATVTTYADDYGHSTEEVRVGCCTVGLASGYSDDYTSYEAKYVYGNAGYGNNAGYGGQSYGGYGGYKPSYGGYSQPGYGY